LRGVCDKKRKIGKFGGALSHLHVCTRKKKRPRLRQQKIRAKPKVALGNIPNRAEKRTVPEELPEKEVWGRLILVEDVAGCFVRISGSGLPGGGRSRKFQFPTQQPLIDKGGRISKVEKKSSCKGHAIVGLNRAGEIGVNIKCGKRSAVFQLGSPSNSKRTLQADANPPPQKLALAASGRKRKARGHHCVKDAGNVVMEGKLQNRWGVWRG